jgi:hypothetical protein
MFLYLIFKKEMLVGPIILGLVVDTYHLFLDKQC